MGPAMYTSLTCGHMYTENTNNSRTGAIYKTSAESMNEIKTHLKYVSVTLVTKSRCTNNSTSGLVHQHSTLLLR